VARVDRAQQVRAGCPPHLLSKFLDAHGANHLPERQLNRNALLDRAQQELARELRVLQVARETEVPVSLRLAMSLCLQVALLEAEHARLNSP
jgi:hypothetical protein